MKRFLSLLFLSVFVVFWAGCQKEPNNPIGSEYTEEDGGGGSETEMIYYEFPNNIQLEDCKDFVTDLVINDDLSDWTGSGSMIVGTMKVTHDANFLYFIFDLNEDYENDFYISKAGGSGWVVTAGDGRYVPPGIRTVSNEYDAPNALCTLKLDKNYIKYIGPKKKDYSFYCNDYLGLAGFAEICRIPLGDIPIFPGDGEEVTMTLTYPGLSSYFGTNILEWGQEGVGMVGWCVDIEHTINPGVTYSHVKVYSSYATLPTAVADQIDNEGNFPQVNWIINNITIGQTVGSCSGTVTWQDIQIAIWKLIDNSTSYPISGWSQCRVDWIVNEANKHTDFVPGCNQKIAIIMYVPGKQITIVERNVQAAYPVLCSYQGPECQTAWAYGNRRYCLQIPGFPGRYWYWVTTGYKWCCK